MRSKWRSRRLRRHSGMCVSCCVAGQCGGRWSATRACKRACMTRFVTSVGTRRPRPPLGARMPFATSTRGRLAVAKATRRFIISGMRMSLTCRHYPMEAREFLCWQPHSEDGGHYFAVAILEDGMLSVMDSAIGQQIDMLPHEFRMAWLRVDRLVFFILELWPAGRLLAMDDEAYDLAGGGARAQKLSSQFFAHVKAEVNSPAFPIVESGVYTFGLWPTPPPHACVVREKRLGCRLDYLAMPLGGNRLIVGFCSGQMFQIVGSSVVSLRYLWALKLL